jgi:hypothetical protein
MVLTPDAMAIIKQSVAIEIPAPRSILPLLLSYNLYLGFLRDFDMNGMNIQSKCESMSSI